MQTSLLISGGANGYANGEEVAELGCPQCPRINETPLIEPLVCKKIAHERLTALVFREDCLVTACQDGYVCTWARPGKVVSSILLHNIIGQVSLNSILAKRPTYIFPFFQQKHVIIIFSEYKCDVPK